MPRLLLPHILVSFLALKTDLHINKLYLQEIEHQNSDQVTLK